MRPTLLTLLTTVAIASAALSPTVVSATTPTTAATATPKASKPKDACGNAKSKWQRLQCEEFTSSAPGDEYFGRMKISYLGINNTYKDGSISAGAYTIDPRLISKLDFASEALERWAAKYPGDPQLPRSYFLGVQVLRKVYTEPEQQRTWQYIEILVHKYGNTYFGKVTKASIAHGYTEHWFANAQICPTPLPPGVMPETTPSATATPTPAPGQPAVDVITPPCVQPSIAPEEATAPTASTSPGSSASPNASASPSPSPHP